MAGDCWPATRRTSTRAQVERRQPRYPDAFNPGWKLAAGSERLDTEELLDRYLIEKITAVAADVLDNDPRAGRADVPGAGSPAAGSGRN